MKSLSPKSSILILWIICIITLIPQYYLVRSVAGIFNRIDNGKITIPFDTGSTVYILLSMFWIFLLIETLGNTKTLAKNRNLVSPIIISWFMISIFIAIGMSYYIDSELINSGYTPCIDESEVSRISLGNSLIYKLEGC